MPSEKIQSKRGFTAGEKWIIWGVFCLLIALSTYRVTVFIGLMLAAFGINSFIKKQRGLIPIVALIAGILSLAFSKFLF